MSKLALFAWMLLIFVSFTFSCGGVRSAPASEKKQQKPVTAKNEAAATAPAFSIKIAENGKALLPIVVANEASPQVKKIAGTLAEYLRRISGAPFTVANRAAPFGPGAPGIVVAIASDFSALTPALKNDEPGRREDYLLRSHEKGVLIAGASAQGVESAVWDFLYHVGYRQFFPGEKWEVVPKTANLSIAVNAVEHPAYLSRLIAIGGGQLPENREKYANWKARNRVVQGITLMTSHSYGKIITRNKAAFDAHPEYYALVNGERKPSKFCISNAGLRQLVLQDALGQFEKYPLLDSVSLDPSDGGGWCECADCARLGSITDRVVTLANEVATGIHVKYPGKFIGMYAYFQHSPPPSIAVHPNVVVSIATAFIQGGYNVDQLVEEWSTKTSMIGIRDYFGVFPWDKDLPGRAKGGNLTYLKTALPHYYKNGARFFVTETSDSWGPLGLGHYVAARILWNPRESSRVEALVNDFLERCFGAARVPMANWYALTNSASAPLVSSDLIGRMYRELNEALKLTDDPLIRSRILDLALYTRYVELYSLWSQGKSKVTTETVQRFAYRIRETQMVHSRTIVSELVTNDPKIVPAADRIESWKSDGTYPDAEIERFITEGMANNPILNFQAVAFSDELVPATPLRLTGKAGKEFEYSRGDLTCYTWAPAAPTTFSFQGKAGIVYDFRGSSKITLYPKAETHAKAVDEAAIPPDKVLHDAQLKTPLVGLQRITVSDSNGGTTLVWPKGTPLVIESSLTKPARIFRGYNLYFYVPKGTRVVGGYGDGYGTIVDGAGAKTSLSAKADYWSVPVAPGQDGKLWHFENTRGQFRLMTVPPYLARSADEMLLPQEVVTADTPK